MFIYNIIRFKQRFSVVSSRLCLIARLGGTISVLLSLVIVKVVLLRLAGARAEFVGLCRCRRLEGEQIGIRLHVRLSLLLARKLSGETWQYWRWWPLLLIKLLLAVRFDFYPLLLT